MCVSRLSLSLSLWCSEVHYSVLVMVQAGVRGYLVQLVCFRQEVITHFRNASIKSWLYLSGKLTDVKHCIPC